MKKICTITAIMIVLACMAAATSLAAGGKVRGDKAAGPAGDSGNGLVYTNRGGEGCNECQNTGVISEPMAAELMYIRQEEKLARDVYLALYEFYYDAQNPFSAQIFWNIAASEQRHMDAVKRLLDCYGLDDPVSDDTPGVFPESGDGFGMTYDNLITLGQTSYCEALGVGRTIEILDIQDIEIVLEDLEYEDVEAPNVVRVMNNLLSGSFNHLEAFENRMMTLNCPSDGDASNL